MKSRKVEGYMRGFKRSNFLMQRVSHLKADSVFELSIA
jgi:hypothetical protein